jgi:streptomycin 3"-adenylyltransferase
MEVPFAVQAYVSSLHRDIRGVLGPGLEGLYLHGSSAMGCWSPETSDVDLLAVASRPLTDSEKANLAGKLQSRDAPGRGLEFSIVVRNEVAPVVEAPPFELHVTTGLDSKVVDGARHPGDPDLVMHFAMCRERGFTIAGLPPNQTLPDVRRTILLATLANELAWALEHAPLHYAVLNACRAEAFASDGKLLSKLEGARWALDRSSSPGLISAALKAQEGAPALFDSSEVRAFVTIVLVAIQEARSAQPKT